MIYGFISDCALWRDISIANNTSELNQGVGLPTDLVLNNFVDIFTFKDERESRETSFINNVTFKKGLRILSDDTKNKEDLESLELLEKEERALFFTLLEKIYLYQDIPQSQLNKELAEDFAIYKEDSLNISAAEIEITIKNNADEDITLKIPDWIEFTIVTASLTVSLHLWLNEKAFIDQYPLSTIVKVILPCDPEYMINNDKFTTKVDALIKSNEFSFVELSSQIGLTDHTGFLIYKTRYVLSSTNINMLPFGILYKGAIPGSLEVREAIRNELATYTLIPQSIWEQILPDLFVVAQFFIIPIWDHTTVQPDRTLYPSVINFYSFQGKVLATLPEAYRNEFFKTYFEILTCGYSEIFSGIIPNPINAEGYFSFYTLHPTYQYHNATDAAFAYMEAHTKEFNIKFNKCIAILSGETTSGTGEYVENTFNNKRWLSFIVGQAEYHVLRKEDFTGEVWDGSLDGNGEGGDIQIYNQLFIRGANAKELKASVVRG